MDIPINGECLGYSCLVQVLLMMVLLLYHYHLVKILPKPLTPPPPPPPPSSCSNLTSLWTALSFLTGPFFGNLSDSYGRKPIIIICLLAQSLAYLLLGLQRDMTSLTIYVIVGGMFDCVLTTAYAICTDLISEDNQAHAKLVGAFGYVGSSSSSSGGVNSSSSSSSSSNSITWPLER